MRGESVKCSGMVKKYYEKKNQMQNIYLDNELNKEATSAKIAQVQIGGGSRSVRSASRPI